MLMIYAYAYAYFYAYAYTYACVASEDRVLICFSPSIWTRMGPSSQGNVVFCVSVRH